MASDWEAEAREQREHRKHLEEAAREQIELLEDVRQAAEEQNRLVKQRLEKEQAEKDAQDTKRKDIATKQGFAHLGRSLQLDPRLIEHLKDYAQKNLSCDVAVYWAGKILAGKFSNSTPILEIDSEQFDQIFKIAMPERPACPDFYLDRVISEAPEFLSFLFTHGDMSNGVGQGIWQYVVRERSVFIQSPNKPSLIVSYFWSAETTGINIAVDGNIVYSATRKQILKKFICLGWGLSKMRICAMQHLRGRLKNAEDGIWAMVWKRRKKQQQLRTVARTLFIGCILEMAYTFYIGNMALVAAGTSVLLCAFGLEAYAYKIGKNIPDIPTHEFFYILAKKYQKGRNEHD